MTDICHKLRTSCISPEWPAPPWVQAWSTTRIGGVSQDPFRTLNLAQHVGDDPRAVLTNRRYLCSALNLPGEPLWLSQVHGARVVDAGRVTAGIEADAVFTDRPGIVCSIMTADCLPLLVCDLAQPRVAAVHAGWRGLAAGVVERTIEKFAGSELIAWMGPAISQQAFEVGADVYRQCSRGPGDCRQAFRPVRSGRWLLDIYRLARQHLRKAGVEAVYGGGFCTVMEEKRFFSFRREGTTGRMANLIWVVPGH